MSGASRLLIHEAPLQVLPSLAKLIGLNEAIILQQIHYWIKEAERVGRNFHDGQYWVYNSGQSWQAQFPFWSLDTVRRLLTALEERKLLIVGHYNQTPFDRTKWHRIDYDALNCLLDVGKMPTSDVGNMPISDVGKMPQPIPETTRDIQRLTINSPEPNMQNGLLGAVQKLPYWGPEPTDAAWLEEFTLEYPDLSVEVITECRDYWDGRRAKSKGAWKHRLRNWCKKRKEFATDGKAHSSRALPESYTPTREYPDL